MRICLLLFFVSLLNKDAGAQTDYNLKLLSNPTDPCSQGFNDVWGFQHSNGKEYAVLGTRCGTSIYDLADPRMPILVAEVPGAVGIWRDLKNWGDQIYVVADQGGFGIQVIDMSDPTAIKSWKYNPVINQSDTLWTAHNLFIDALGYLYIAGSQFNSGGVVIFDLNQNDSIPPIVGYGPAEYAHDVYVNEARSMMITSDIYAGVFTLSILDRSVNPIGIDVIASQETGLHFTHNAWTTEDGNTVFTTDERIGAKVESYDISNPDDIKFLAEYAPYTNLSQTILPHNVHLKGNHLIISYYSEGIKVVDISQPDIPVEVGSYDTNASSSGSSGAWGAFPFFNSGLILGSDMTNGLFVLEPDYSVKVGYMKGSVMSQDSTAIDSALIRIFAIDSSYQYSRNGGQFKTGLVDQTTFAALNNRSADNLVNVQISRFGFETKDTMIEFIPDTTITVNFILKSVALPVELINFSIVNINCQNKIQWKVGSEINHSHFEVQVSEDGQLFHSIARVLPEQAIENTYSFTHHQNQVFTYYRLKQVDVDGAFEYSKVISQSNTCEKNAEVAIYPNPTSDFISILHPSEKINFISILNYSGQHIKTEVNPDHRIDVRNLQPGVYVLQINSATSLKTVQFIKST